MHRLIGLLGDNLPLGAGVGLSLASGATALTGSIPEGIPPWAWAVWTVLGPIVTGLCLAEIKVRRDARAAKKRAAADEERKLAARADARALAAETDKDPANDKDAVKLRAQARAHRMAAVEADAIADAVEREAAKG